ncbi:MAG: aldolase/citrate lyase family protein [Thiotrichales bacterium]|nr:aldolase/citrate lyase family protein [Thiotrichales bacterium]
MIRNSATGFSKRLRDGETLIGCMVTLECTDTAELLAGTGFDWLFIDAEHGAFTPERAKPLLQAAHPVPCLIRIPEAAEIWVKKALDIGSAGIVVPQVNHADDVRMIMNWARYAPEGARGVGIGRAHAYGRTFREYLDTANEHTAIVIQAETRESVENIDAITSVNGVDAILVGPYDLSSSLGKPGRLNDPGVIDAISKVRDCCHEKNIPLGFFGVTADAVRPYMEQGFTLIIVGVDTGFMLDSASTTLNALRPDES